MICGVMNKGESMRIFKHTDDEDFLNENMRLQQMLISGSRNSLKIRWQK